MTSKIFKKKILSTMIPYKIFEGRRKLLKVEAPCQTGLIIYPTPSVKTKQNYIHILSETIKDYDNIYSPMLPRGMV